MDISLKTIRSGFDYKSCWVAPFCALNPEENRVIASLSKLDLTGSDVFEGSYLIESRDGGVSWCEPVKATSFNRVKNSYGGTSCCEINPFWHKGTSSFIGFGNIVNYTPENEVDRNHHRPAAITWLNGEIDDWTSPAIIELPAGIAGDFNQIGMQQHELDNGELLLPIAVYRMPDFYAATCVVKLQIGDGEFKLVDHGGLIDQVKQKRGLYEPSLIRFGGRYFMNLRNDITGYVCASDDGLNFEQPRPWCFDNGELLGNYNTQMRWVKNGEDELYVVYTRRNADNDNVFRHRAPLFIAKVDTDSLRVIRDSEKVLVPNRGARLGNFGAMQIGPKKAWVTVAEWMQNDTAGYGRVGAEYCVSFGSDNSIFLAEISW